MHLLLTDRLICPRCGPGHGLILLAEQVEGRRVREGVLGCSNCRERYVVTGGVGDLRPPPRSPLSPGPHLPSPDEEEVVRTAALLGVTEGPAFLLFMGAAGVFAPGVARLLPEGVESVVAGTASVGAFGHEGVKISRMTVGEGFLPLFPGVMRAVAIPGPDLEGWGGELHRVLAKGSAVVVLEPMDDSREILENEGFRIRVSESEAILATRA